MKVLTAESAEKRRGPTRTEVLPGLGNGVGEKKTDGCRASSANFTNCANEKLLKQLKGVCVLPPR
jgi:hypothetical protein